MTEVIELLSSSPPRPATVRSNPKVFTKASIPDKFDVGLSDFDENASLDFSCDRPAKRFRPSPTLGSTARLNNGKHATNTSSGLIFDLGSDDSLSPASFQGFGKQTGKHQVADEIIYSSSAPEPASLGKRARRGVDATRKSALDDFLDDDLAISQSQPPPPQPEYGDRTANLLASIAQASDRLGKSKPQAKASNSRQHGTEPNATAKSVDEIEYSSPVRAKVPKPSKLTEVEKAEKAARAAERAARRASAKEVEKARKQAEKAQKDKEKQRAADLAEVNKSRTNKKDATPEMIIEMSSSLRGTSLGNQVEKRMDNVQVEVNYIDEEIDLAQDEGEQQPHGSIITWRRKVNSSYNEESDQWEPASRPRIVKEKHVLIHLAAGDFAAVAAVTRSGSGTSVLRTDVEMKANLDAHVLSIRRRFGDCVPIYLIEGLRSWLKKNLNAHNRTYTAAVRAQMLQADTNAEPATSQGRVRKRKKPAYEVLDLSHVTTDIVEDLLLHVQLAHQPILIHHTPTPTESASQISALTQHLSTRPYRKAQLEYNLKSASFCMDGGQVKTGDNPEDTFAKMLQELTRVTPSMALGIVKQHKSIRKLVKGFDKHGNLLLEDVRKAVNKDGGWSDKRLGPQVSKRLFKVFMGRDPTATDGMS